MRATIHGIILLLVVGLAAVDAAAQTRPGAKPQPRQKRPFVENGFIAFNAAGQFAGDDLSDRVLFEANAETGTLDADYGSTSSPVFDGGFGMLVHRQVGVALSVSYASRSGSASVRAQVPHPFFDDRHRPVEGEASDISRRETAIHAHMYYEMKHRGPWRVRFFGGPSYFRLEQELVTGVETQESFPFDTAEFRRAITERAKGSGIGVNAGLDVTRMLSRRAGLGALVRYTGASMDLDAPGSRSVSTTGGGLTAGVGLRVAF